MKTSRYLASCLHGPASALALALALAGGSVLLAPSPAHSAQRVRPVESAPKDPPKNPPPPVSIAPSPATPPPAPAPGRTFVYEQSNLPPRPPLVRPDQAETILRRFQQAYPAMGKPRLVFFVNRNLIDSKAGIRLIARTENTRSRSGTVTSPKGETIFKTNREDAENRYRNEDRTELTLAERQTVRDIERAFGRPLTSASAVLVDQRIATDMMDSGEFKSLKLDGQQARKDREALSKHADVAIEILVASKEVKVQSFNGQAVYAVPDIQATAIRLSDARILGQASSADLSGAHPSPAFARSYGVEEITEATALALMEDMAAAFPPQASAAPAPPPAATESKPAPQSP